MARVSSKYLWIVILILGLGMYLRVYRINDLLGFFYDQGRDAQVIWNLVHEQRFFLIGPTTGIEGIFRGPWYYWLILPAYLLGGGNPVWPSVFLSATTVLAAAVVGWILVKMGNKTAGLLAITIVSTSFYLVQAGRWLSNPTPMFLISALFVANIYFLLAGRPWAWWTAGGLWGLGMQFGSAVEIFYLPALFLIALVFPKSRPNFLSIIGFFVTAGIFFLPQIIFDIRHDGVLSQAVTRFLFTEQSFKISLWQTVSLRLSQYNRLFSEVLFTGAGLLTLLLFILRFRNLSAYFWSVVILLLSGLFGMLFFQGNNGNVYDYYFTGLFLVFVIVFCYLLSPLKLNKWLAAIFMLLFLWTNIPRSFASFTSSLNHPNTINLIQQKQAIDWIFNDAGATPFNVDVYVPPVIPHSYNYLLTWLGTTKYNRLPSSDLTTDLYLLYEEDPPHPERLAAWLARQQSIASGSVVQKFGGITVEKRERLP